MGILVVSMGNVGRTYLLLRSVCSVGTKKKRGGSLRLAPLNSGSEHLIMERKELLGAIG